MFVLALDCAGDACSVAIVDFTDPVSPVAMVSNTELLRRGHAERVIPMLAGSLADAGLTAADLDLIAVTVGPGAFTGIRIGLAAAKGIACVSKTSIAGVLVNDCLAAGIPAHQDERLVIALDSRRADPFVSLHHPQKLEDGSITWGTSEPSPLALNSSAFETLLSAYKGSVLLAGSAAESCEHLLPGSMVILETSAPDPVVIAKLGRRLHSCKSAREAEPVYLRAPDVSAPSEDRHALQRSSVH